MSIELCKSQGDGEHAGSPTCQWLEALAQLTAALAVLDSSDAPPEIGAAVDLAANRLREAIQARHRSN